MNTLVPCLRVRVNLQPEEVNAHSLEGPGDMGCRGSWVLNPEVQVDISQAPTEPPTPSQATSASERMNVLLLAVTGLGLGVWF